MVVLGGKMGKCIICHKKEATVPDRSIPGRPIKRLCGDCHSDRLRGDLKYLLGVELKKPNK